MMRFADFVVALPFLLFMILFKIAFGIGPGESGVMPMLVALVLLVASDCAPCSWANSANQGTGVYQRVAVTWCQNALFNLTAYATEYPRRSACHPDVRYPQRDFHRGVFIFVGMGVVTAHTLVGVHVERGHKSNAYHAA